jgi:UbiD family decarboxylase
MIVDHGKLIVERSSAISRAYAREVVMEMSVTVGAGAEQPEQRLAPAEARPNPNSSDLDAWLEKVETLGELKRITAQVDPDLEAATITYLVGSAKSPALLFENIKGHPGHRALYNMIGCNLSRFCLMIGEKPVDHPLTAVQILQHKLGRKMPPKEVAPATAICNQNIVTGDAIDIRIFPAQRMWPLDGGKYLGTGDAVVTKDPETGRINVGTYRMMIKGPREVGVYTSPGKDATIDREKWWRMGKPMPIAACYGIDPLLFLVAATSLPKTESEYEYYSGINGAPIELFTGDVTGLPLPARAEIILEGFLYPDETFAEGPFGEFTGYYGRPSGATPYMRVEKVRYRDNPTLTCALMADGAANEAGLFWAALRSAGVWADLQKLGVPGIRGVWSIPEAAGWGITVVSLRQMYAGHAAQVMALAAQCTAGAYFGKYVIVVDDDVDPTNIHQVLWAMATRSRPAQSIDILRETWSTYLDPSLNPPEIRPWGSKALINACMDYKFIKSFSRRTKLSRSAYETVVRRWQELGLSGTPPAISIFEEETYPERIG